MSAVVVATYRDTVGQGTDVATLAALARNPAIRTLFGEPIALDDPGGFTVWRTGTVLAVLLSAWGALAATRITRGEEDTGRWDLLLAGRTPVAAVAARHLAVLAAATALAGGAVTGALLLTGTGLAGAFLHGAGLALVGAFFVAAGGLSAQVFTSRSAASGAAVEALGASLLLRMIGDGLPGAGWLRWLSPFGLTALARPYADNRVLPLLVLALAGSVLFVLAVTAASRRDIRGGWLAVRSERAPWLRLLGSVEGFAVRRLLRPWSGWAVGLGAYYLLIGVLTVSLTDFLTGNPRFADLAGDAGFTGLGTVSGYAATLFALLAVPVGVFTATRLAALAADETAGRLTLLYAQPLTRLRLLAAEAGTTLAGAVALAAAAGVSAWLGTVTVDADLGFLAALAGVWNVLPIVGLCLGAGVLALGWAPRAVVGLGALPATGGFLLLVIAQSTGAPTWVSNLSPFAHLAPVPRTPPNWPAAATMTAIAVASVAVGTLGYQRRDLSS